FDPCAKLNTNVGVSFVSSAWVVLVDGLLGVLLRTRNELTEDVPLSSVVALGSVRCRTVAARPRTNSYAACSAPARSKSHCRFDRRNECRTAHPSAERMNTVRLRT